MRFYFTESGRLCYRTVEVDIFHKEKGFWSRVKLDTRKYNAIGFNDLSLNKYIREVLIGKDREKDLYYHTYNDRIKYF